MASEIRVNTINNRSGLGTISITNSGAVFSGVTTFAQIQTTSGEVTVGTGASVYSPATNVLALGTNNAERVRINSSGFVGIGSQSPISTLDISESDSASVTSPILTLRQGTGLGQNAMIRLTGHINDTTGLRFRQNGNGNNVDKDSSIFNELSGALILGTNNLERLRITSAGKVGINTESPRAVLDIEGNAENAILMLHSTDLNANLQFSDNTGGARILNYGGDLAFRTGTNADVFGTGDTEKLRITSTGNVGIGTDNPDTKLDLRGQLQTINNSNTNIITYESSSKDVYAAMSATNGEARFTAGSNQSSDVDMVFRTAASGSEAERLRIDSAGNIGINNNNPLYVMHFRNAMTSTPSYIHMEVTGSNTVGGGGGIQFDTSASSDASNNGLYLAQISGERSASDNGSNTLVFKTSRAGSNGDDGNPNSPKTRMTIDENGNVTINDGNLVIGTSGHGIDFSATGGPTNGTGSSELLDDYEEGSWTPAVARTSPTGSATYTRQSGRYTKIGNVVTIWFDIYWSAAPNGSGDYVITSLPYTAQTGVGNGDGGFGAVQFRDASGLSSDIRIYGNSSYHSDTRIFCQKYSSTGVTQSAPFEAAGRITGWSQYFTNS